MLGLPTQLVILSEAKDPTDASISIADRRVVPGAGSSTKDPPTPGKPTCGLPVRLVRAIRHPGPALPPCPWPPT